MNDQRVAQESAAEKARSPMWDLLKEEDAYRRPKRGDILEAEVVRIDPDAIIVDIGSKTEGIVPASELEKLDPSLRAEIAVGSKISVYVVRPESPEGEIIVSLDMARAAHEWQDAKRYQDQGLLYEGSVAGFNKGGLIVPFGTIRGFLPSSQLSDPGGRSNPEDRERYLASRVGQSLSLKVIEVDRQSRRLIFSERAAAREAREVRKERLLAELQEGQVRHGRVSSLADFGAFVDLGGADGLIHISELSWQRVQHPQELLQVGQELDVYILRVDHERKRIGLSLRKLRPDPWREVEDKFRVGQIVEGIVTHLVDFGAFARIVEGVEGLIHISELGEGVRDTREVVAEGQTLPLKIISIDAHRQRIGLSLKQAPTREEMEGMAALQAGVAITEEPAMPPDIQPETPVLFAEAAQSSPSMEAPPSTPMPMELGEKTAEASAASAAEEQLVEQLPAASDLAPAADLHGVEDVAAGASEVRPSKASRSTAKKSASKKCKL